MARKIVDPEQLLDRLGIRHTRKGRVLWASCPHPDHNDSSPSWRIIDDTDATRHGQHRCYGCGFGGWAIHLVEAVLGCSRQDAREWLRDITQDPPLPFAVEVEYQHAPTGYFKLPHGVTFPSFDAWPKDARAYAEGRGLAAWQIHRWGIGVAPGRYDRHANPLAGRIVFPVRDVGGKLIGYTGRSYTGSERRYKEPSRAEGADLGAVFGEEHWPKERKVVVVTEGAIDALAVERVFPYSLPVAGIYGSQLHDGHVNRLSTFEWVLMATDPDRAGNQVANALRDRLRRWSHVVRVDMPEGEDAASLSLKDAQALKDALSSSLSVVHGHRHRRVMGTRQRSGRRRTEVCFASKPR